jgi:hypothetical protein
MARLQPIIDNPFDPEPFTPLPTPVPDEERPTFPTIPGLPPELSQPHAGGGDGMSGIEQLSDTFITQEVDIPPTFGGGNGNLPPGLSGVTGGGGVNEDPVLKQMLEAQNAGFVGGAGNPALASLFPEAFGSGFTQFEQNTPLMGLTGMAARRAGLRSPEYRAPQGTTRAFRQRVPGGFQLTANPQSSRPGADFGGGPGTVGGFDAEAESHDAVGSAIGDSVAADLGGTGLAAGLGMGALGASMGLGLGDALGIALGSGTMAALSPIGIALGLNNALGMSMDASAALGHATEGTNVSEGSMAANAAQMGALDSTSGGMLGHGLGGVLGALGLDSLGGALGVMGAPEAAANEALGNLGETGGIVGIGDEALGTPAAFAGPSTPHGHAMAAAQAAVDAAVSGAPGSVSSSGGNVSTTSGHAVVGGIQGGIDSGASGNASATGESGHASLSAPSPGHSISGMMGDGGGGGGGKG